MELAALFSPSLQSQIKLFYNMGRILAVDYGNKRTGLAVTDPLRIIASPLATVDSQQVVDWIINYTKSESVDRVIVGLPLSMDGSKTDATDAAHHFIRRLRNLFPELPVEAVDEQYTSKMAEQALREMGLKKKEREKKEHIDQLAAVFILRRYLGME
jgi:putative Holliday junction resolvase